MNITGRFQQIWKWVGLVWVAGFIIFVVYNSVVNGPKAELVQGQLVDEFKSIEPPPGSRICDYRATHKPGQALVTGTVCTSLPYAGVRAHYDAELARRGWTFYEEDELRDWGRDFGGRIARYCKGEYRAALQYDGENANDGRDYAFNVSWGLGRVADKSSDKFSKAGCR